MRKIVVRSLCERFRILRSWWRIQGHFDFSAVRQLMFCMHGISSKTPVAEHLNTQRRSCVKTMYPLTNGSMWWNATVTCF